MILYIHGFAGSGKGVKATQTKTYFGEAAMAPSLPYAPDLAFDTLVQIIERTVVHEPVGLIGSSLGGFYAIHLARRYRLKAVLVNPSITPWKTLGTPGIVTHYHDLTHFEWSPRHIEYLKTLRIDKPERQENLMLMVQRGDEVLDHRIALDYLPRARHIVEEGGSHAFEGFESHLPAIERFLSTG